MKFAISSASRNDHEAGTIVCYCALHQIPYRIVAKPTDVRPDEIPVGNVPWVTAVLGHEDVPDYYPDFLAHLLHRKVWRADKWPYGHRVFIKPSDRHKRFTGFVTTGTWKGKKKPPFYCSEIVEWISEWRFYIAAGQVRDARWNFGEERPVPALTVDYPPDYYGAVDFGLLSTGEIALIEANTCFSVGWYGPMSEGATYVHWLADSWVHLTAKPREPLSKSV